MSLGVLLLGLLAALGAPQAARAEGIPAGTGATHPLEIEADAIEHLRGEGRTLARGHVRIRQGPFLLKGDEALYDRRGGWMGVRGSVFLSDGHDTIDADEMQYYPASGTGVLWRGRVTSPSQQFRIVGRRIERLGPESFRIEDGRFTTCLCACPQAPTGAGGAAPCEATPPWEIGGSRVDVVLGGYATVSNVVFRTQDVPIFWLPWGEFPVKLKRETGFLLPSFNVSSLDGLEPSVPYYWALAPNADATLTADLRTARGWGVEGEGRYVESRSVRSEARGLFFDESFLPPSERSGVDGHRWQSDVWLDTREDDWGLAKGVVRQVGDPLVLHDLSQDLAQRAFGFDETEGFAQGSLGRTTLRIEARSFQNLVTDPAPGSVEPVRRLPRLTLENQGWRIPGTPVEVAWVSHWDRIDRRSGGPFDDLNGTGSYLQSATNSTQRSDPVRVGDRLLVAPAISAPLNPAGWLQVQPRLSGLGRLYDLPIGTERRLVDSSVQGSLQLSSIFGRAYPLGGTLPESIVHTVLPSLSLVYVTQPPGLLRGVGVPIGPGAPVPSLDASDGGLAPFGGLSAGLVSYLYDRKGMTDRTLVRGEIDAQYDLREATRRLAGPQDQRRPWSPVVLNLDASPVQGGRWAPSAYTRILYDPNQKAFARFENSLGVGDPWGDSAGVSYNVTPAGPGGVPPREVDWTASLGLTLGGPFLLSEMVRFASGGLLTADQTGLQSSTSRVAYSSPCKCWDLGLNVVYSPVNPERFSFQFTFDLGQLWGVQATQLPGQQAQPGP